MDIIINALKSALEVAIYGFLFWVSFYFFRSSWMFWGEETYKHNLQWILLEIKIPRETTRGPKAMEQFFTSIFNLRNSPVGPKETFWDGEVTKWFTLEIVGQNQNTRLFMRIIKQLRHPITASLYAEYPDLEIVEVEHDYIEDFPPTYQEIAKKDYELYGMELIPSKKHFSLPLRTYVELENKIGDEKGRIVDTMSGIIEIMGRLKPDETAWMQFICIPDTKGHWLHDIEHVGKSLQNSTQGGGDTGAPIKFRFRTQGEDKNLKRMEDKKSKPVFEVFARGIYIAPNSVYNRDLLNRGVYGWMAQFGSDDKYVQRVAKNNKVRTKVDGDAFPYLYPKRRLFWKRVKLYSEYRRRFVPEEWFIGKLMNSILPLHYCFFHKPLFFSSEELATFFHIPTNVVLTSVTMDRVESKRLSPPSNLPS